ncbi:MAG: hypothetical protein C0615_09595 [Desulfuromonas sp.]|nr:MAG: hypothetical protein C0615_09595 [Desulfuromonas sp.]
MLRKTLFPFLLLATMLLTACAATSTSTTPVAETTYVDNRIDGNGQTGITGRITARSDGRPIEGAYVNIYPDTISNLLGPSQFISTPTDSEGNYRLAVPPGTYYVVSRKRMSGQPSGPLSPGDLFSEHHRVVTTVVEGKMSVINLALAPMKAPMFFKKSTVEIRTDTGIRGRLIDGSGKPVPGSFALAYTDKNTKRLPDFASTLSESDGSFVLYLPQGGTYFLGARIHAWDMPRPGELYGLLGDPEPTPVNVDEGQFVEGVEIVLTPFTGTYKEGKSRRPY